MLRCATLVLMLTLYGCSQRAYPCEVNHGYSSITEVNDDRNLNGQPVPWAQSPETISVIYDDMLPPEFQEELTNAINMWNVLLGRTVLVRERLPFVLRGRIYVMTDDLVEADQCGAILYGLTSRLYIHPFSNKLVTGAVIRLWHHIPHRHLFLVIMHELGHALGLYHDSDETSIMYPYIREIDWHVESRDLDYIRSSLDLRRD